MKKILYIAMTVAALSAISCQKEKELHPVGSRIVFSAATEFRNGLETRTLYTGQYTQTNPAFERIQWVSTDQIKILYSHGSSSSATYSIDGSSIAGSGTEKKSTASISVASGSSALEWAEGSSHIFYGLYPASVGTLTAGSATGLNIPATQTVTWNASQSKYLPDMDKAYMVSYKDMSSSQNSTVDLPFTPVMNAVEFKLRLPDDRPSYTVTQVKFSASASTAIAGTYSVNITGFADDAVTWSAPSNGFSGTATGIVVNFNNGSSAASPAIPTSTSGNVLDFTVLTLPVAFSDPLLQIKYSDGHVLKLTLSGLTLQPGQKCIVTNSKAGHDDFTYEVSDPGSQTITGHNAASFERINVTSIKRSGADNTHTEPVAWKVQYYNNTQSDWFDTDDANYPLQGYTITKGTNTLDVSLAAANTVANQNFENGNPFEAATEILKARTPRGSTSSPWDLSTHDLAGGTISQTTANCYVVTAPGVYKFPLIYGNARVLGSDNSEAYHPTTSSSWNSGSTDDTQNYYLPTFYNAKGQGIISPYVLTDLGISLSNVTIHRLSQISDSGIVTSYEKGGTSASDAYITFTITEDSIRPGNIVFYASYPSFSQESQFDVVWSWHIWVTDKNLTPSNGMMNYNLGWVDNNETVTNSVKKYTNRALELRIAQVEGGSEVKYSRTFTLTQNGDAAEINNPMNGKNPHYQWGRKDPFPYDKEIELQQHNDAGESSGYWYWRGIRIAWKMLKSERSTTFLDGKAIPLYKMVQTPNSWTINTGTYGPYGAGALKDAVQGILGTSNREGRKRVTGNYTSWFCEDLKNDSPNYNIPATYWSSTTTSKTVNGLTWYAYKFKDGTILTSDQMTTLKNLCDYYNNGTVYLSWWDWNNYPTFEGAAVENVYYYTVTSPTTITEAQYNNLISNGFPSTGITIGYSTSYPYTTNAERNVGSILQNLWSAYRYNETCSDPSAGKMKTVYDPCPPGFTVPTIDTYLGNASLSGKQATVNDFTGLPKTGKRANTAAGSNVPVTGTSHGYYWTDRSCNMQYNNSGDKTIITNYSYYTDAYILETATTSSTSTISNNIRATAASIRPMVDPRASTIAGHATPAQVSAPNSIESVTLGSEL